MAREQTSTEEREKGAIATTEPTETDKPLSVARRGFPIEPLSWMGQWLEDVDRMMSSFGLPIAPSRFRSPIARLSEIAWSPVVETFEREGCLVCRAELPGMSENDIHVEIEDDELVVSGEREQEKEETIGRQRYSERKYGSFERRFILPEGVDPETVKATFDRGVLEVSFKLPEVETKSKKTIPIQAGESPKGPQGTQDVVEEKGGTEVH